MDKNKVVFWFFIFVAQFSVCAQKNTILLDTIILSTSKVKDFSKGYFVNEILDYTVKRDLNSLTNIIKNNSFLYFKEQGLGMVSSPSFRGTNASQTAVIWNGININSQLNGQVDFNGVSANSYDNIFVKSGGGSVLFGSGAIGGSVHLTNEVFFKNKIVNNLTLNYGSFNTKLLNYKYVKSSKKKYFNFRFGYNASDNDFDYLNSNLSNENGMFYNANFDLNFGYKLNSKNEFKIFSNTFFAERELSRTLNAPSNDSYEDFNSKNLVIWNHFISKRQTITTKIASVLEKFKFFDNKENRENFTIGDAFRNIFKLDYNNYFSNKIKINAIFGFENTNVSGTSFSNQSRNNISLVFSLNQQLTNKLSYGIQFRKDEFDTFSSPFIYSLGIDYKYSKKYTFTLNTSKNFRIPTFNDLYWNPGGNLNLNPETSYQFEIGNELKFNYLTFQLNGFLIRSSDLIQWIPNNFGIWSPQNINETKNIGFEFSAKSNFRIKKHYFIFNLNYSFTEARDLETKEQLDYVPKHRFNGLIDYSFKKFSVFYQQLFNDQVNFLVESIPAYSVANTGFNLELSKVWNQPIIGFRINNLYNNFYQSTLNRPMPGINYQLTFNLNF